MAQACPQRARGKSVRRDGSFVSGGCGGLENSSVYQADQEIGAQKDHVNSLRFVDLLRYKVIRTGHEGLVRPGIQPRTQVTSCWQPLMTVRSAPRRTRPRLRRVLRVRRRWRARCRGSISCASVVSMPATRRSFAPRSEVASSAAMDAWRRSWWLPVRSVASAAATVLQPVAEQLPGFDVIGQTYVGAGRRRSIGGFPVVPPSVRSPM